MINNSVHETESLLNQFDSSIRSKTIKSLASQLQTGQIQTESEKEAFNLHCHTFFSFNAYGFSPSALAWLAKQKGYKSLGIIDFDTLDGVSEFLDACEILGVRGSAGIETRIFIPEFSTREINSPGEPGVCYHIGIGFTSSSAAPEVGSIINDLKQRAEQRNREMMNRINVHLSQLQVNYDHDVLPLTPAGNATERHMLSAYTLAAEKQVSNITQFWAGALGQTVEQIEAIINNKAKFHNLIRSKLMKRGGVGYMQPGPSTFPGLEEVNRLITACGALPCFGWLDGTTTGEQAIEELLELMISKGIVTINIIPDRNWNIADPEQRKNKVGKLYEMVHLAQKMDLPINVGTEMNSPGQKWVDDFNAPEMSPLYPTFLEGAYFIFGHTVMQRHLAMGYQSEWAKNYFPRRHERNSFYSQIGRLVVPGQTGIKQLQVITPDYSPNDIINKLEKK
jgi:hypothetical protein